MQTPYSECLKHIEDSWDKLTCFQPADHGIHIGLPNRFISPCAHKGIFSDDQFYWDSYFIILGLIDSGRTELAKGMVDNLIYMFRRFGIIPSRNRFYNLGISQIPFLTSMLLEVYEVTGDKEWLKESADIAAAELHNYWMDDINAHRHLVYNGLSRYCDHYIVDLTAEHESGWDMTSRFKTKCLSYLPVDLNTCLWKYEDDLSKIYKLLGNDMMSEQYSNAARARKEEMNRLMWNEDKGFFFDYDYVDKEQSRFLSLAGFFPLWAGIASEEQAKRMVDNLGIFEHNGGLSSTQKDGLLDTVRQWDHPNGWAPLQWITAAGLKRYGYEEDGKRIARKWIDLNCRIFETTGSLWEKYDVVRMTVGIADRYDHKDGFGWTNAIFLRLMNEFNLRLEDQEIAHIPLSKGIEAEYCIRS